MCVPAEKRYAKRYQFLVTDTLSSARDDNPPSGHHDALQLQSGLGPGEHRRHALVASGSAITPRNVTLGVIWQLRSAYRFK